MIAHIQWTRMECESQSNRMFCIRIKHAKSLNIIQISVSDGSVLRNNCGRVGSHRTKSTETNKSHASDSRFSCRQQMLLLLWRRLVADEQLHVVLHSFVHTLISRRSCVPLTPVQPANRPSFPFLWSFSFLSSRLSLPERHAIHCCETEAKRGIRATEMPTL